MEQNYLVNYELYGPFAEYAKGNPLVINTNDITLENYNSYFLGALNIMRDGIETEYVQNTFITVVFSEYGEVELSLFDFYFNLLLWKAILYAKEKIMPYHLIFEDKFNKNTIKKFLDKYYVKLYRKTISNYDINRSIDDIEYAFKYNNEFYAYLANTLSIDDEVLMMMNNQEYRNILLSDFSNIPLEEVKDHGLKLTKRLIDLTYNDNTILGYEHGLANFWRSDAIKERQYKEYAINIGTKPNGNGGAYPVQINRSFIMGGTNDFVSFFIDSSNGRIAQILEHSNVKDSGAFARKIKLNNHDTYIHPNPNYVCESRNFIKLTIISEKMLNKIIDKYYRLSPNGVEKVITEADTHLIGKTIYMRSPMTCESHARGEGICHRCYGEFAYAVKDIAVGIIAAELLSENITQKFLSAKHLLESFIRALKWCDEFDKYFNVEWNMICINELDKKDMKKFYICIDHSDVLLENENAKDIDDDCEYNAYTTKIVVYNKETNKKTIIKTLEDDIMYFTSEFIDVISNHSDDENGKYIVPFSKLVDIPLFKVKIQNDDLTKTKERLDALLDKKDTTSNMSKDTILQELLETTIEAGMSIMSVHIEVLLSNQMRKKSAEFTSPDWTVENQDDYQMMTLRDALNKNPSITTTLLFGLLKKNLCAPMSFKKNKAAVADLFFMKQPQKYLEEFPEKKNKPLLKFNEDQYDEYINNLKKNKKSE